MFRRLLPNLPKTKKFNISANCFEDLTSRGEENTRISRKQTLEDLQAGRKDSLQGLQYSWLSWRKQGESRIRRREGRN